MNQGIRGAPGRTGPAGKSGLTGERGIPGAEGKTGDLGPRGSQGIPGPLGLPGEKGHQVNTSFDVIARIRRSTVKLIKEDIKPNTAVHPKKIL